MQTNQKHMNQENRIVIEKGLDASKPMSTIASELSKDPTTISKEIKKHRILQKHKPLTKSPIGVRLQRTATGKTCARPMPPSVNGNAGAAPNATGIALTLSPSTTTVHSPTRHPLSAMAAAGRPPAGWTSTITAQLRHTGSTGLSLQSPGQASASPRMPLPCWTRR